MALSAKDGVNLDAIISMDNAKYIKQLPLIFMNPLCLHIKHCIQADLPITNNSHQRYIITELLKNGKRNVGAKTIAFFTTFKPLIASMYSASLILLTFLTYEIIVNNK